MIEIKLPLVDIYEEQIDNRYQACPLMLKGFDYDENRAELYFNLHPDMRYDIIEKDGSLVIKMEKR